MTQEKSSQTQSSRIGGIVLKVENLASARVFYRDILNLGPPAVDSNFWVEFKLGDGTALILEEAIQGEKLPYCRGRIAWVCKVQDFKATVAKLREKGHEPVAEDTERGGVKVLPFCDPEGNPFYLISE